MIGSAQDLYDEAVALRELLDEHVANLQLAAAAPGPEGLIAIGVSSARRPSEFERHDLLPGRRSKHPAHQYLSREEGREHTLCTLRRVEGWLSPLRHAEQHHGSSASAIRYWYGLLGKYCKELYDEGLAERRCSHQRGVRYEYRLLK